MSDHFVSIAVMIDDLRGADREARLVAMRALLTIALTLGPERTREELLPYITDYLDEDDEVLRAMASCLGVMVDEVGGMAYVQCLLQPLELLCTLDEVTVRDAAVTALVQLGRKVLPAPGGGDGAAAEQQQQFTQVITRLGESEHPQSRCSAAGLVGVWYSSVPPSGRADVKAFFGRLCEDAEVMVRRAACVALGTTIADALQGAVSELVPALVKFSKDANDSVRLQAIPAAVGVAARVEESQLGPVVQAMRALGSDAGWRVRFMLADRLGVLAASWPARDAKVAAQLFTSLCGDSAPEIRAAVVHTIDSVLKCVPDAASKADIVQAATKLADDQNPHVRACVAASLLKATPHTPSTLWSAYLIPTSTRLLQDGDATVRLGVVTSFSNMATAAAASGTETTGLAGVATALVPAVVALIKDASWRVRESVLDEIPGIVQSGATGTDDLVAVCTEALVDRVASIRTAAAAALCKLFERRGAEWGASTLLPSLAPMSTARGFVQRVTVLHVLRLLIDVAEPAFVRAEVLPLTQRLAADPVGNVRTGAAHVIRAALTKRKVAPADVEATVSALKNDSDVDVRDVMTMPAAPKK